MLVVGLTGSIAMGKSTTAAIFAELGYKFFDADKIVHDLYDNNKYLIEQISIICPSATKQGFVDRKILSQHLTKHDNLLKKIENIIHPIVGERRKTFISKARKNSELFVILDIPLLFETGGIKDVDKIIVVTASKEIQRARALARENMTQEKFDYILSKQVSDEQKREQADFIVDTSVSRQDAIIQVEHIARALSVISSAQT